MLWKGGFAKGVLFSLASSKCVRGAHVVSVAKFDDLYPVIFRGNPLSCVCVISLRITKGLW